MNKLTKEQARELGITPELMEQLPENILGRLDILQTIIGQYAVVNTCRAKMETKHGEYNTARKALKDAQDTLNEMIQDANAPTLFNRPVKEKLRPGSEKKDEEQSNARSQETDDFGGAPKSPFGKKAKSDKKDKKSKSKRDGLEHPAVKAITGQGETNNKLAAVI